MVLCCRLALENRVGTEDVQYKPSLKARIDACVLMMQLKALNDQLEDDVECECEQARLKIKKKKAGLQTHGE
jgi:hypothetical protein